MITKQYIDQDHVRDEINSLPLGQLLEMLTRPMSLVYHDHNGAQYSGTVAPFDALPGEIQHRIRLAQIAAMNSGHAVSTVVPVTWYYVRECLAAYALTAWKMNKNFTDAPEEITAEINRLLAPMAITYTQIKYVLEALKNATDLQYWKYLYSPYTLKSGGGSGGNGAAGGNAGGDKLGLFALAALAWMGGK